MELKQIIKRKDDINKSESGQYINKKGKCEEEEEKRKTWKIREELRA